MREVYFTLRYSAISVGEGQSVRHGIIKEELIVNTALTTYFTSLTHLQ